ncbi:MAG: hypothetical protein HYX89_01770 [Chloroflexi bacterium]|nr:hypothetical protein [Chloroflexota bacterium]
MTEKKPQYPFERGPYIQAASFCDQVIEGKDGVLSLIRLVNRLGVQVAGPEAPEAMPPTKFTLKLVLVLNAGDAKGRHDLTIVPQLPSGETKAPMVQSVHLEPGKSSNLIVIVEFTYELEGQYWFNVLFDGLPFTKIAMEVRYTRLVTGSRPREA